jgi:ABC-type lipoprotein release transport system permease subunit
MLNKPGQISEILALQCRCESVDRLGEVRAQLEKILPEVKVTEWQSGAVTRAEQRKLIAEHRQGEIREHAARRARIAEQEQQGQAQVLATLVEQRSQTQSQLESLSGTVTPLVVMVCAAWVGLLSWTNVRQRRAEIGLWRALGKRSRDVAALFLGKAALIGLVGGAAGCALGAVAARQVAVGMMDVSPAHVAWPLELIAVAALGAPLVAVLASYLPTLSAVTQDPALALRES